MPAVACLRVALDDDRTGLDAETVSRLVAKFSSAYLETRWTWPRRFEPLTSYSFLLTDPGADEMDPAELSRLSEELQVKLFGERGFGEVTLLLFEGPLEAVTAFAALDASAVARALDDISLLPAGGRLTQIRTNAWELIVSARPVETAAPSAAVPEPPLIRFQGVYLISNEVFVGDVISATPASSRVGLSLLDGPAHLPTDHIAFDSDCLEGGLAMLSVPEFKGVLYFPVSYSSMARPSTRAVYEGMFAKLPADRRRQLAAAVYDVPRDPGFSAMTQLKRTLSAYFGSIQLGVTDPEFQVETLPPGIVSGVNYVLPEGDVRFRLKALRRFVERRDFYRRKQIWASITNVRTRMELEACATLQVQIVTGPAVCPLGLQPVGGRVRPMDHLPVAA